MRIGNLQFRTHNPLNPPGWDRTPTPHPTVLERAASILPVKVRKLVAPPPGRVPSPVPAPRTHAGIDAAALGALPAVPSVGNGLGLDIDAAFRTAQQAADAVGTPSAAGPQVAISAITISTHTNLGKVGVVLPPTYRLDPSDALKHLRPPSMVSAGSSGTSTVSSSKTVMRTDLRDVLGPLNVHIKAGGEKRLLDSVPTDRQPALAEVIDQIKAGAELTVLSQPTAHAAGMASASVTLGGQARSAFVDIETDGRISSIDVSDPVTLESELGAHDAGKPAGTSSGPRPVLAARHGVKARVDIAPHVQCTEVGPGRKRYEYFPLPAENHGLRVQTNPSGELWLSMVSALPALAHSHGSGTDMVLGVAARLNADGFVVRAVRAAWVDEPGIDGELVRFEEGVAQGLSPREAALGTFSGKAAALFGFTDVEVKQTPAGGYNVQFRRPPDAGPA
jgi:hypothetical protein